ncbi:MAG TPA: hypothetical protein PLP33_27065 [Leptospiraceae bacterium]|nr:hypothetical protein [Leptospiraceae bacterium]
MLNIKLHTDFRDCYDYMFDREGIPFIRFSQDILSKREQFKLLEASGFLVPPNNYMYKLVYSLYSPKNYVVYVNPNLHRGEGKLLISRGEALSRAEDLSLLNCYASHHIDAQSSKSHRILNIGNRQFRINYSSDDTWRSNCGNVKVEFDGEVTEDLKIPSPLTGRALWAIDFVANMYAVDLNTSPSIKGSGVEDILSNTEIYELIRDFYSNLSSSKIN